jgi:GntR family transcriptional regulator
MFTLNRHSSTPLYQQLYVLLRQKIDGGEFKDGIAIPTEKDLVKAYDVSRVTTRKAMQLLVDDNLVVRIPGKGTFVQTGRIEENLISLQGFAELMVTRYPDQVMEVHSFEVIPAPNDISKALQIQEDSHLIRIKRRHVVSTHPLALAIIYLPFDLGKSLTVDEVSNTPIYTLLTQKEGVTIEHANQRISAVRANGEIADLLEVPRGSPVLLVKRITYSEEDRPLEYIELYYPGEQHELIVELHRNTPIQSL